MKRGAAFILLLFTLSGVSGLIYEIAWIRLLSHLLGGTSFAISTVLAVFMGGLAWGSRHFGDRADGATRLLPLYARLEFGIAAFGALAYVVIHFAPPVYAAVASGLPQPAVAVLRVLIAALLLLPPTFLMGGTLPVLSRFVVRSADRLGSGLGLLYAVNTFGAVVGCFLAGFVLIPGLGVPASVAIAVALNLVIGASVLLVARRDGSAEPAAAEMRPEPGPGTGEKPPAPRAGAVSFALIGSIFALSGFASLGYELYWTRALQPFLGNSTYAFSAMLTTFLFGLAIGGWLGGRWADRHGNPTLLLGGVQIGVGCSALLSLFLIWGWLPGLGESNVLSNPGLGWNDYLLRRFLVAFGVMAVPTLLTGMTFPIVSRIGIAGLQQLGRGVGRLYFLNTLGSIAGSLAAGFLLLPLLGAKGALAGTALLSAGLGVALLVAVRDTSRKAQWIGVALLIALTLATPAAMDFGRSPLADTQTADDFVLFEREDYAAATRVYRKPSGDRHISVDGYHIGGTEGTIVGKEKILAHLPLALRPEARHTLSVGLGSGITLGTLALYEGIERLDCVEIVPGVVEGAGYFAQANRNVLHDPRVHVRVGDGVQFLLTSRDRYDVISSDSKLNPEYAGNGPLLSRDYYELCRDRLTDDGVMVQWLATHLPVTELEVIVRSFVAAFDHVAVYWLSPYSLILAGSRAPLVLDLDAVRAHAAQPGPGPDLRSLHLDNPYVMAGLFLADRDALDRTLADGPQNTWSRPRIEFTMLREYRRKSPLYHGADNLRWMKRLRSPGSLRVSGEFEPAVLARFQDSALAVMDGYLAANGTERIGSGKNVWIEGLRRNPDDQRLAALIEAMEGAQVAQEQAAAAGTQDTPAELVDLAATRMEQKRWGEALELLDRARGMDPNNRSVLFNRLLSLRALGRREVLAADLVEFRRRFPEDARGYDLSGRMAADGRNFEEASKFFRRAVELDPVHPGIRNNLATTLVRLDRYADAAVVFGEICGIQPDFPQAAFHAAACYSLSDQLEDSARWVDFCLERGLASPEQFESSGYFENLRASQHWPRP